MSSSPRRNEHRGHRASQDGATGSTAMPAIAEIPPTPQDCSSVPVSFRSQQRGRRPEHLDSTETCQSPPRSGPMRSEGPNHRLSPYLSSRREGSWDYSDHSSASISDIGSPALSSSSGCYFTRDDASSRSSWSHHAAECADRAAEHVSSYEGHDVRAADPRRNDTTPPLELARAPQPVSVLIPRTGTSSHARKKDPNHIPRPRNAFILFRSHAHRIGLVPKDVTSNHSNISVIISHMWRSLPDAEKQQWYQEAEREKEEHRQMYPDYKFAPVYRRTGIVRRTMRREEGDEERCLDIADQILKQYGREGIVRVKEEAAVGTAAEQKAARRAATKALSRQKAAAVAAAAIAAGSKAVSPRKASRPRKSQARSQEPNASPNGSPGRKIPRATTRKPASGGSQQGPPSSAEMESVPLSASSPHRPTSQEEILPETAPEPVFMMPGYSSSRGRSTSTPALEPDARLAQAQWQIKNEARTAQTTHDQETTLANDFGGWQHRLSRVAYAPGDCAAARSEVPVTRSSSALGHSTVRKGPPAPLSLGADERRTSLSPTSMMQPVAVQSPIERPRPRTSEGATPLSSTFRGAAVAGLHWHGLGGHEMLVSPMHASFGGSRRPSVSGWQPWPARQTDVPSRGRGFSFTTDVSRGIEQQEDVLFWQGARMAAASSGSRFDESHIALYDPHLYSPTTTHGGQGSIGTVASAPSSSLGSRLQPDYVEIAQSPSSAAAASTSGTPGTRHYTSSLDVADVAPGTGAARLRYHIDDEEIFAMAPRPAMPSAANQRRGNRPRSTSSAPPPEGIIPAVRTDGAMSWDVYSALHVGRPIEADTLDAAFSQLLNVPITPTLGSDASPGAHVTFAPLQQSAPAAAAPGNLVGVSPLALALSNVHWADSPSSPSARATPQRASLRVSPSERTTTPSDRK